MSETIRAPVDVFEKARTHDRLELLEIARQGDLVPYFRVLTSEAGRAGYYVCPGGVRGGARPRGDPNRPMCLSVHAIR